MTNEKKRTDFAETFAKSIKATRLDIENPHKKQEDIPVIFSSDDDEDENTLAKSLIDGIIEETENDLSIEKDFSSTR